MNTPVEDALELVAIGPMKTMEWVDSAINMGKHCREHEDVDQAAARILADEVKRLRGLLHELGGREDYHQTHADRKCKCGEPLTGPAEQCGACGLNQLAR